MKPSPTLPASTDRPSSPKQDLRDLIDATVALTADGEGVLPRLVDAVKTSNHIAAHNNIGIKRVSWGLAATVVILVSVSLALWFTVQQVQETQRSVAAVASKLGETDRKVQKVQDVQEKKADQDAQETRVEIVRETDPEKAKESPLKVLIHPPTRRPHSGSSKSPIPPPVAATVEVPLKLEKAN